MKALRRRFGERRHEIGVLTARRALATLFVVPAVTLATFALAALSPLDPLVTYLGDGFEHTGRAERDAISDSLGLDVPFWQTWWNWMANAFTGDFGASHSLKQPVTTVFAERLPWTLGLSVVALVIALLVAFGVAAVAALRPDGLLDRALERVTLALTGMPPFVIGLLAVALFAVTLRWFPVGGLTEPGQPVTFGGVVHHIVMPAVVLALSQVPWFALALRESVREALGSGAVREAQVRGLSRGEVLRGHIAPVSAAALIALMGARLPELVVGALVVEEVFSWPGLADATVEAALTADFALLAAVTAATTLVMMLGSWLSDCALLVVDPRAQVER
ncbi:ABC transporter permease [Dermacoccus sp. PE3]|uniref:ABC transporter permease n=1 Tax=Dermacoccus sp. PE3 TaxID=1641401 RepID=UPI000641DB52|nr:ABC transporter permease [Dermacoccus sp. PE3]KLO62125.1 ABC transporter permease [Dermacoccus sp. PE3]